MSWKSKIGQIVFPKVDLCNFPLTSPRRMPGRERGWLAAGALLCCAAVMLLGGSLRRKGGEQRIALEWGSTTYVTPGKYDASLDDMLGTLKQNSLHAGQEANLETKVSASQLDNASRLKSAMVHILRDLGDDVQLGADGDAEPGTETLSRDQVDDLLDSADDARESVKDAVRNLRLLQERQQSVRAKAQRVIEGLRSKMAALEQHNAEIAARIAQVAQMHGPQGPKGVPGLPGPDGAPLAWNSRRI
jgi:hypothetical protein